MKNRTGWRFMNLVAASGMLVYAVPRLIVGGGMNAATLFTVAWVALALLVIGANLHELLGVEQETRERMRQVKRARRYKSEQRIMRRVGGMGQGAGFGKRG